MPIAEPTDRAARCRRTNDRSLSMRNAILRIWCGLLVAWVISATAAAQPFDAAQFFKGKTVRLTIPTAPGGAYGAYGLVFVQHFGRHLPGEPAIVPEYRPGAGGVVAANYLYNVAPRDGTVIGIPLAPIVLAQYTAAKAQYDVSKFGWIGQMAGITRLFAVWESSKLKTFDDLIAHDSVAGSTGRGSETFMNPALMNHVFGTRIRIVGGYKGSNALMLALERGEISAVSGTWANFAGNHPDWLRDNKVRFLVQIGLTKVPEYKQVPLLVDLAKSDPDRRVIEYMSLVTQSVGYSVMTPPGVPPPMVAVLRKAFEATMRDPAFLVSARKCCVDISPAPHTIVEEAVAKAVKAPKSLRERFVKALGS
jgi:tripartite-type tricarboxylate transporter receptor subunit TctC